MKKTPRTRSVLALMLALVMVLTMIPSGVMAAQETIWGDPAAVKVGTGASDRENNFNKGWKFYLGDNSSASGTGFDDSGWEDVDLPHDFSITQAYTTSGEAESGFLPGGTGWYRKSFTLDQTDAGKTFLLNFDGVYMHAYVYVNGTFVGEHHYGYTAFAFDISDYLTCDGATENVIAVKAVNNLPSSRWYSGSGIYRDVTLYVLDSVHTDLNGVTVTTPNLSSGDSTVSVKTELVNDGDTDASVTVTNTIYSKEDMSSVGSASQTLTVSANSTATAETSCVPSSYALWSLEDPNLYIVETQVSVDGEVVDTSETTFGFRWFTFNSQGFQLNGVNVKLNGVCMHHDQGGLGSAAYYDAIYRQMSIMKEMGCNAIRTAHNPADQQLIEICSELGLLVIEEVFDGITQSKNGNSNDFASYFTVEADSNLYGVSDGMLCSEYATRSTVKRDKNAASVFAWSFGNEIQEGNYVNDAGYATYSAKFIEWVNDEDGTRITTMGDNTRASGYSYVNQALTNILNANGVVGFNYHYGQADTATLLAGYGGNFGTFIASETASHVNSRSRYMSQNSAVSIDGAYHLTSYDTSKVGWGATAHDSMYDTFTKDYIAGQFVWTGFDYLGEPTPWNGTSSGSVSGSGATPNSSYFGIVETTGFPKDNYYLYRAQWNKNDTTVHLVTAWDDGNMLTSSGKTPVWLYSNAYKVELYLNGSKIGTAVRTVNTTDAGHSYNTYTATSNDTSVCTVSNGSGSSALYAVFNVAYTAGTLSTRAYNEDGSEITLTDDMGKHAVTTPGTVTKLVASANKNEIAADGSSLVYVEVDVTDASGNLDTMAANNITFSVEGPAVIAAVDNGDQATTAKYQQSSVLTSDTTANINAYAGKALVILRSTEEEDTITLNIASSGLTGQTVTVNAVSSGEESEDSGLVSYSMIRDYTIKAGTVPTLDTAITGTLADGSTVSGTIEWETVSADVYGTYGDYTITGTASFAGLEDIPVSAKLHVIPNIIDLRNVSTATMENLEPTLPGTVRGVLADGTLAGEFVVEWDAPAVSEYDTVDEIVTVTGTAVIFGDETMDVTCAVRVAEAVNTESENVATGATLSQDIATANQSDNLNSINDGVTNPGESTNDRWTNWGNRYNSDTATITLTWPTAVLLSDINVYYRYDNSGCVKPASVVFSYSLDGTNFVEVGHTESALNASVSNGAAFTYALDQVINPVAIQVTFTQANGTSGSCVGVYELETMTYAAGMEYNSSADLSAITVDGTAIDGFSADTLTYEADQDAIGAETAVNAGITVLPVYEGVVRILTVSEDGSAARTYEVTVPVEAACEHANTYVNGAVDATCTTDGYTGDTICADCGVTVATGTVSATLGHSWSDWTVDAAATCTAAGSQSRVCSRCNETQTQTIAATGHQHTEVRDAVAAGCESTGYTGDTICSDCGETIATGTVIAAKGHSWNAGEITQEPTETEDGVKTYTCTVCGATKTEAVSYQKELKAPTVSLALSTNASGQIVITGQVDDYENLEDYYEITAHGVLYIKTSRIGTRLLTLNTSGRTKVSFSGYTDEGAFTYNLKPTSKSTMYAFRAYVTYVNTETGKTVTVYSDMIRGSYNTLQG